MFKVCMAFVTILMICAYIAFSRSLWSEIGIAALLDTSESFEFESAPYSTEEFSEDPILSSVDKPDEQSLLPTNGNLFSQADTSSEPDELQQEIYRILKDRHDEDHSLPIPFKEAPDHINKGNQSPQMDQIDLNEELEAPPQPETFPVIFKAYQRAIISARVTATVLIIPHRMGERFKKGDLLIQLDDTVFKGLELKALGALAKAEAELSSKELLYKDDIASIYEIKTAEANVAAAKSDLINARYAIDACHIVAPYDGKVVSVAVEEYELIQDGKPLIEIVNDTDLIGQILAPSNFFSKLFLDQPLKIYVKETNSIAMGKILRLDAVIDPASSLLKVDVLVNNQNGEFRAGMIGQVILDVPPPTPTSESTPGRP